MDQKRSLGGIATFAAIAFLLTAADFVWMFGAGGKNPLTVAVMMWIPGIAALLTVALHKIPLSELGWRAGRLKYWALAFSLPILVSLLAYGSSWIFGITKFYDTEVINYRWIRMLGFDTPGPFLLGFFAKGIGASLMALPFVLGEEIGWSGFLVPHLRKRHSPFATSLIVGLSWSVWHYPAIIGGLYGTGAPLWVALPGFTLALTGASFFRTVLVSRSGSLWPGVILHISHNVFLMGMFYEMTRKTEYSSWLVSESGLYLGAVYLACGICYLYIKRNKKGLLPVGTQL
jgi:membrane protease YdiL (CAAX protease family)